MNKSRYVFFILACLFGLYVQAQNRTVKGRVLSAEDKEPLIGATVKIPGTSIGVVTDIDGNFSLEVPDKDKTLVIEFLGMSTLTAKIPANGVLNVSLHPDTQRLDEVVVTGYGNFSKSSFTGSANTLRGDLLKNVPVVSVEQKLQGMTPAYPFREIPVSRVLIKVYVSAVWGHSMHRKNLCLSLTEYR